MKIICTKRTSKSLEQFQRRHFFKNFMENRQKDAIRIDLNFWCLMPLSAISWRSVLAVEEAEVHRSKDQFALV
jgi:hypothetical protein